jgi:hypothetical protein
MGMGLGAGPSLNGLRAAGDGGGLMGTPKTGASKMAAAAKRGQAGIDGLPAYKNGMTVPEAEDHPLSDKSLKARYVRSARL